jgi:D-alanyl-D-alanine carboxypeptidase/D-alanyl-D-alanine-endopeptidase (penicillin-binding protein 4)
MEISLRIPDLRNFVLLGALLVLCNAAPTGAQAEERLPVAVSQALKSAGIPPAAVAIVVQEVAAAAPRISINAAQPMNPASLMKLLTTYAALDLLGPSYTWSTEAWINGKLNDGVLDGDLILKGSGDPKLTFEQFWLLLRQMRGRGVREIRGDLVLDRSLFEVVAANDNIIDDQPLRPYNVVPDALLLNFKSLRIRLIGDAERKTLDTLIEPQPANLDVINLIKPGSGGCGDWKESLRADLGQHGNRLILTGSYPMACGWNTWNLGVLTHPQYVEGVFRQLWQELGGTLGGALREAPLPADARLLASIESPTLSEMVRDINKYSNNVMARQLFLTLSSAQGNRPARTADAETVLRAWLTQKELRFPELQLENGSGLSRRESIAAGNLARLLASAWKSPLMPEFIASLPLAGVDGTMKKRLKQNGLAGRAHIKTGSLEGVKAIAGYVLDRNGKWQIVVFLVNHPNASAAQAAQDALLQWVYERG